MVSSLLNVVTSAEQSLEHTIVVGVRVDAWTCSKSQQEDNRYNWWIFQLPISMANQFISHRGWNLTNEWICWEFVSSGFWNCIDNCGTIEIRSVDIDKGVIHIHTRIGFTKNSMENNLRFLWYRINFSLDFRFIWIYLDSHAVVQRKLLGNNFKSVEYKKNMLSGSKNLKKLIESL